MLMGGFLGIHNQIFVRLTLEVVRKSAILRQNIYASG